MVVIQFPTFVKVSALPLRVHKHSPYCISSSETSIKSRESIICLFLVQRIKCEVLNLHKCASMDGFVCNDNRFRAGGQDGTIAKAGWSWTPKCYSLSAKKLHNIKLCHNDFSSTQAPIALFNVFFFFLRTHLFAISYFWRQIIDITREPFAAAFIDSSFFLSCRSTPQHLRTKALRCNESWSLLFLYPGSRSAKFKKTLFIK